MEQKLGKTQIINGDFWIKTEITFIFSTCLINSTFTDY